MSEIIQVAVSGVGVLASVGLSGALVRFILSRHAARIEELERFRGNVKMPNVGESMCNEKHGQMEKGLKFLFEEHKTLMSEIKTDHDAVTVVTTELREINKKLDKINNR